MPSQQQEDSTTTATTISRNSSSSSVMVTTRRQEQLLQSPASAASQQQHDASPATPVAGTGSGGGDTALAQPPAGATLPLKSALKPARLAALVDEDGGMEATPLGAGIKKRVRIHSSNNMVHEFQTSHSTEEVAAAAHQGLLFGRVAGVGGVEGEVGSDDDATPDSAGPRRRRPSRRAGGNSSRGFLRTRGLLVGMFRGSSGGGSGGTAEGKGSGRGSSSSSSSTWLGVLFTLCWMFSSSALIFVNKQLMVDNGFRFPFALTALGQASSMMLAWLASLLGLAPLRPPPSAHAMLTRLLPVSLSFAASLFLGNVAYLGLSVAFVNIMKAATPMVTLALGLLLGLERLSKLTLLATTLIALGTYTATASEAASGHFHWLAFLAFAASVVFEGIRVVLTEKLLGQARYNVMEALVYLGPFTFGALAVGAVLFEWEGLCTAGWALMRSRPSDFLVAAAISFLVNLFCYLAIKHVSATSFKVAGCLKNVMVVWGGIVQGDVVSMQEMQGYGISLAGFVLFSLSRLRAAKAGVGQSGDSPTPQKRRR